MIAKIGDSDAALKDMKNIADELAEAGNKEQAELLKYFAGYIYAKRKGGGELKDEEAAKNAYENYINTL